MFHTFTGRCGYCEAEFRLVEFAVKTTLHCPVCYEELFSFKRVPQCIYVIGPPRGRTVFIGMTEGSVDTRLAEIKRRKQLKVCSLIATWPSERPEKDQVKLKQRLSAYEIGRGEYELPVLKGALEVYRALGYRRGVFHHEKTKSLFEAEIDRNRETMSKKLGSP